MLDERSLDIISKFKQALINTPPSKFGGYSLFANRGAKSISSPTSSLINNNILLPKVVEYEGSRRLVLTNDSIERNNEKRKRKWRETYGDPRKIVRTIKGDEDEDEATNEINGHIIEENGYEISKVQAEEAFVEEKRGDGDDGLDEAEIEIEENEDEDEDEEEDEDDESDDEDSDDENPFKKIKVTEILAPLSHPSEVISHPAILKTFKLPIFNKLAYELIELIEVEQENLNWLNKLLQVLNGEDWFYLLEENLGLPKYDHGLNQLSDDETPNTSIVDQSEKAPADEVVKTEIPNETAGDNTAPGTGSEAEELPKRITRTSATQDEEKVTDPFFALPETLKIYESYQSQQVSHDTHEEIVREELVNYLQVSIQRQQEYIKNLSQLRNGLVRSDRLRQDIHKWGKEMYEKKSS